MAKIAVFEMEDGAEMDRLKKSLRAHSVTFYPQPLSRDNVRDAAGCDAIAVFIYSKIDSRLLAKLPELKMIATMSTGTDHIDMNACKKRGITVSNVPAYGEHTVAEHTFALILAITRRLLPSVQRAKSGDFSLEGLTGLELEGKTLGIVGTGKIGSHVARIAHAFGMKIIASARHRNEELERLYGVEFVPGLVPLLSRSDIITLHAPLTDETLHMINRKNVRKIKRGAILINTARGALVETEALLEGIKSGVISYAGLDVLEEEGFIREEKELLSKSFRKRSDLRTVLAGHMLLKLDNVIITPHNAFNSMEAMMKIADVTSGSINRFFRKK
ncbi:MAG TPA: NAD(P)-dependent oxidoreductase [Candidatus Bilamarchaeum sp.]|nr:NAD(P)-dependent oxidoreductase [Candidatus Bilamarchaeum sp.]